MKKIFFYTDTPIYGGAERHITMLARNLDSDKYEPIIIFSNFRQLDEWSNDLKRKNIKTIRISVFHKHDPRHFIHLKRLIAEYKPDILHLHLWNPVSCRYAFLATQSKLYKIVVTEHDPFPIHGLRKLIKNHFIDKTSHTIAVSEANLEMMKKEYPKLKTSISFIHNGIELDIFSQDLLHYSSQNRQKIRQNLFRATQNEFIVITVAALHERKGLVYLIRAIKEVKAKIPNIKLIIVGNGPQKNELMKTIATLGLDKEVMLLGKQEHIPKILKSSDLFVLPSIKEAFGLVLLEAMACQLPIIASNVGGIPEIIQNHKNGELVEAGDTCAIADKIVELYENKAQREKIAFIGNHDVKKFGAKEMALKTERIYDQVMADNDNKNTKI